MTAVWSGAPRAQPCVYFRDPQTAIACFVTRGIDVPHAVQIAAALRRYFAVSTWVADWALIAHDPTALDLELADIRRRLGLLPVGSR